MRDDKTVFLPGDGRRHKVQPQASPFAPGAKVFLHCCPHVEPGTVLGGTRRGMVRVKWTNLGYTGHHRASALMAADHQECPDVKEGRYAGD